MGFILKLGSISPVCRYVPNLDPRDANIFPLMSMVGGMSINKAGSIFKWPVKVPITIPVIRSPTVHKNNENKLSKKSLPNILRTMEMAGIEIEIFFTISIASLP